ncbi:MAG: ATP-binding protein [Pseudomonadota bacterium]
MKAEPATPAQAPHLIAMAGLPGSGKSTIAEALAHRLQIPIVSVDPIEAAMWRSGLSPEDTGIAAYRVAQTIAAENLKQGLSVIVDAVNPVKDARQMWRETAEATGAKLIFLKIVCSNKAVHKARIEARKRGIDGMPEVPWHRVEQRAAEYENWVDPPNRIDTATINQEAAIAQAINIITQQNSSA